MENVGDNNRTYFVELYGPGTLEIIAYKTHVNMHTIYTYIPTYRHNTEMHIQREPPRATKQPGSAPATLPCTHTLT